MSNQVSGVFAVYDRAAERFSSPFVAPHQGVACRVFSDAIKRPGGEPSDMSNHPDDFDLYCIGEFDAGTGIITPDDPSTRKPLLMGKQVSLQP